MIEHVRRIAVTAAAVAAGLCKTQRFHEGGRGVSARAIMARIAFVGTLIGALGGVISSPASANIMQSRSYYIIKNKYTGKCLDVSSTAPVITATCDGSAGQRWYPAQGSANPQGSHLIKNDEKEQCIENVSPLVAIASCDSSYKSQTFWTCSYCSVISNYPASSSVPTQLYDETGTNRVRSAQTVTPASAALWEKQCVIAPDNGPCLPI
ncbi:ricin-type beta-trefoil lectin domain protein [Nonomuraea basaltis]|uniref:ricin-type beta-trefoil lectin domain protein n=1 Tax=Nonomuraea basaltis TaxID=2495887 RepID=UPI00110C51C8|nr:RICIN domain-containing protein [Nonomuraea basaltis]TMR89572.1 hypothetical protein EJK15_60005 [Nonomuraea basaltis]